MYNTADSRPRIIGCKYRNAFLFKKQPDLRVNIIYESHKYLSASNSSFTTTRKWKAILTVL